MPRGAALLVLNRGRPPGAGRPGRAWPTFSSATRAPRLVAPALRYPDGRPQSAAFRFPGLRRSLLDLFPVDRLAETAINGRVHAHRPRPRSTIRSAPACSSAAAAWHDVGPLDEGYFMYLEEVDWCQRARSRGWQIWQQPRAIAIHHGGASTRQQPDAMFAQLWRSRLRYYQRFSGPT